LEQVDGTHPPQPPLEDPLEPLLELLPDPLLEPVPELLPEPLPGGAPGGPYCSVTSNGMHECYGYANLTSAEQGAVAKACTESLMGTLVTSCPDAGRLGCCSQTVSGYTATACYYLGDCAALHMACTSAMGSWTTGSTGGCGGVGSSSGSGGGSGASSSNGSGQGM